MISQQHRAPKTTRAVAGVSLIGMLLLSTTARAAPANTDLPAPTETVWSTYHSSAGGFSLAVPGDWSADESIDSSGVATLTLTSLDGAQGIAIRTVTAPLTDTVDLPNQMCAPFSTGGLTGVRCIDTLSRAVLVTLSGPTSTFQFVSGSRGDSSTFDQVLASFLPDPSSAGDAETPSAPAQVVPPSISPQPDICAPRTTPISKANPLCPPA